MYAESHRPYAYSKYDIYDVAIYVYVEKILATSNLL